MEAKEARWGVPVPGLVYAERMDGLTDQMAQIGSVPVREVDGYCGRIIQIGGDKGVDAGQSGAKLPLVKGKISGGRLFVQCRQRLLDHIPAVDAEVGGFQGPSFYHDFISQQAVR